MTPELIERYKERLLDLYTAPELVDVLNITAEELLVTFEEQVLDYIENQMDEQLDRLDYEHDEPNQERQTEMDE